MSNPYLEDDDFRNFLRLARRGGKPAASGGEDAGPRGIDLFSHPEETGWVADPDEVAADDGCPIPNAEPPWAKKDDAPDPDVAWYVTKARDLDGELQVRIEQLRSTGATLRHRAKGKPFVDSADILRHLDQLLAISAELCTVQREFAELVDALRQ